MLMVGWFSPLSKEISPPQQKPSKELLSVEFHESGSCVMIGQFCRDLIGCETQIT